MLRKPFICELELIMVGRSIPSFGQLIEIERLNWSDFKWQLPSKKDKEAFDMIFENTVSHCSYLSNANNPIPLDSIIMGTLFHNYKVLIELSNNEKYRNFAITVNEVMTFQGNNNQHGKILFDRICKNWKGLIYILCI